jgi:triacylglycerol lipase
MKPYSYLKQLQTIIIIEVAIITIFLSFAFLFWFEMCPHGAVACLKDSEMDFSKIVSMSFLRPILLTPVTLFNVIAISSYGKILGSLVAILGSLIGAFVVFGFAKIIGQRIVGPWLSFHLPKTFQFWHDQDWKIVLLLRLIPFFPFDVASFIFGILNFRSSAVLVSTLIGIMPEVIVLNMINIVDRSTFITWIITSLVLFIILVIPSLFIEFLLRKRKKSLWSETKAVIVEIKREVILNTAPMIRTRHKKNKKPLLLLYGFFSSRKSLTVLERLLTYRGYEVITFNLGGILGTFYNKGIIESAKTVDGKMKRQFEKFGYDKISIVAHSKGGLVALWWVLKLGGHKYCDKVITLATPFKGTWWTWLGLVTPLGFFFRDLWQMRPGSNLQKVLSKTKIPEHVSIYNFYSYKDLVVPGKKGIFSSDYPKQVVAIQKNVTHYGFLHKRSIAKKISEIIEEK